MSSRKAWLTCSYSLQILVKWLQRYQSPWKHKLDSHCWFLLPPFFFCHQCSGGQTVLVSKHSTYTLKIKHFSVPQGPWSSELQTEVSGFYNVLLQNSEPRSTTGQPKTAGSATPMKALLICCVCISSLRSPVQNILCCNEKVC